MLDAGSVERILLVEGVDDKHVVSHLCGRSQSMPEFEIVDAGGLDRLLDQVVPHLIAADRQAVGILVDADDDVQARWESIADRRRQVEVEPPATYAAPGTIIDSKPRVGVWLMPDNQSPGELEDFIAKLIPAGDPVWPMARRYIDGIPSAHRKFKSGKVPRAKIHAWLATREAPRKMGAAVGVGDLDAKVPPASSLASWLRRLFR